MRYHDAMAVETLREEIKAFEVQKAELLRTCPGQFVLIKGREIVGTYPTRADAYVAGVRQFLRGPFLIKRVVEHENPEQVPLLASSLQRADL